MKYFILLTSLLVLSACDLSPSGLLGGKHAELVDAVSERPSEDWDCYKRWVAQTDKRDPGVCTAPGSPGSQIKSVESKWETDGDVLEISLHKLDDGSIPEIAKLEYKKYSYSSYSETRYEKPIDLSCTVQSTDSDSVTYRCLMKDSDMTNSYDRFAFESMRIGNSNCSSYVTYSARSCTPRTEYESFSPEVYIPNHGQTHENFPTISRGFK